MSSVNRGTIRNENDYYVTPHWLIREFLKTFLFDESFLNGNTINPETCLVHDPAAGGCDLYEMSYPKILKEFGFEYILTSDIREDSRAEYKGKNYLTENNPKNRDLIITNPPFDCSVEFTQEALTNVKDNGLVVMLQRLNWLGTKKRKPFWDNAPLKQIYVHHKRPGFDPEKPNKTDSIEYAHFVFQKGYVGPAYTSII